MYAIVFFVLSSAAFAAENTTHKYDALGRLIETTVTSGPTNGTQTTVTYDPAGNRSNYTVAGAAPPNPATLAISGSAAVTEGASLVFTVTRSGNTTGTTTVNYATADGTAVAATDYTASTGTLAFTAGETAKTISVATTDDATVESAEMLTVSLSGASAGALISTTTATGTINDNDSGLSIAAPPAVTEGSVLSFIVTRTGATGTSVSVNFATADGTANADSDYAVASGILTFGAGETSKTISVNTIDDAAFEATETVTVNLSGATGGAMISGTTATGSINDNDAAPSFAVSASGSNVEGSALTFTVTKSGVASVTHSVNFATADGTALAVSDYTAASGTLTFGIGETSKVVTISTADDALFEQGETVFLNLSLATDGAVIGTIQATGAISNNDPAPGFTVSFASPVNEGASMTFTIVKSGATALAHEVNFATADGSAAAGSDYTAVSGTLSFAAGETSKTVTVQTVDDVLGEAAETVLLNLSLSTGGATITTAQATGTINENDIPPPTFGIIGPGSAVIEGGAATFTITKAGGPASAFSIDYGTSDSTAVAGADYVAANGTLSFAPGETSKTITVATIDDATVEGLGQAGAEAFLVSLSNPSGGATIGIPQSSAQIIDNEASLGFSSNVTGLEGTALSFTVTRGGYTGSVVSVSYVTSDNTATAGSDYTTSNGILTFSAGETAKVITVFTADDTLAEPTENFLVTLSNPTNGGYLLGGGQASGSITNSVTAFSVVNAAAVTEGASLVFPVTRSGYLAGSVSLDYVANDFGQTATPGDDYPITTGTLTFAPGETTKNIVVPTNDDAISEQSEFVTVKLSNPSPSFMVLNQTSVAGTINDNDTTGSLISISSPQAVEGQTAIYTISRTGNLASTVTVSYATVDGTALAGTHYTAVSGTVTFAANETGKTVNVPITNNLTYEDPLQPRTFRLQLSNPTAGATFLNGNSFRDTTVTDDEAIVFITPMATGFTEGTGVQFEIRVDGNYARFNRTLSASYSTSNGSAVAGSDYTTKTGIVTFPPGSMAAQTITVSTINDTVFELDETFSMTLSNPNTGTVIDPAKGSATATIIDNDPSQSEVYVKIEPIGGVTQQFCEGSIASFTVTRNGPTAQAFSVNFATANGTAVAGLDYTAQSGTLNFASGETTKTILVPVVDDTATVGYEDNEAFYVNLSSPTNGAQISTGQATGTVVDWNVCNS
jgi:Calx-beta domain